MEQISWAHQTDIPGAIAYRAGWLVGHVSLSKTGQGKTHWSLRTRNWGIEDITSCGTHWNGTTIFTGWHDSLVFRRNSLGEGMSDFVNQHIDTHWLAPVTLWCSEDIFLHDKLIMFRCRISSGDCKILCCQCGTFKQALWGLNEKAGISIRTASFVVSFFYLAFRKQVKDYVNIRSCEAFHVSRLSCVSLLLLNTY